VAGPRPDPLTGLRPEPLGTPGVEVMPSMGTDDKVRNEAQDLKGQAKEAWGDATDDEQLQAEGKSDQAKSDLKQAGEKVKDAFKK
jgi:uncharacterized protein YjbJ (UPF0337 family)